jgi:hypothetical protein
MKERMAFWIMIVEVNLPIGWGFMGMKLPFPITCNSPGRGYIHLWFFPSRIERLGDWILGHLNLPYTVSERFEKIIETWRYLPLRLPHTMVFIQAIKVPGPCFLCLWGLKRFHPAPQFG